LALRENNLHVYNTLTRTREKFVPLAPPRVGMYVCGPTVYGDAHIGHAKSYVSFDVMVRYLRHLGYQVTYIQNITDVGHLTDDADQGEDKVERKARAEQVHPMQIAEGYTRSFFEDMDRLNVLRPDISPRASGHVIEQIELVKKLLEKGHAYESNGSVYFDVASWPTYGKLSGRSVEQMQAGARVEISAEKRHPADFAIWKRAEPGHIMQWPSPWGMGFPGWHLECSAMSMKYLGETLDIHGGGLENSFPHHEDEIAQSEAATGKPFVKYWLHNNMVTVGGQKMGKSLGNFITLKDAFKKWDPMVLRMFILQSHYRSPLDFSDEALGAAKTGYERLSRALGFPLSMPWLRSTPDAVDPEAQEFVRKTVAKVVQAMDDDFNTPLAIAALFDMATFVNTAVSRGDCTQATMQFLQKQSVIIGDELLGLGLNYPWAAAMDYTSQDAPIEGPGRQQLASGVALSSQEPAAIEPQPVGRQALRPQGLSSGGRQMLSPLTNGMATILIDLRNEARKTKNFAQADAIRKRLDEIGIVLEDSPEGTKWRFK
jgi:cysteinyl-tRNA synthetase